MIEFKFRAWDKREKEMHKVCRLGCEGYSHDFWSPSPTACDYRTDDKERYEFMQFTGLHDRNGKEIWEGDVLGRENFTDWVVEWVDAAFCIWNVTNPERKYPVNKNEVVEREVIGNIHENPGILKDTLNNGQGFNK